MSREQSPEKSPQILSLQPPDLGRLALQVGRILAADITEQEQINQLLQLTLALVNGAGAVFYREANAVLQPAGQLLSRQAQSMSADLLKECEQAAVKAISEQKASVLPLSLMKSASILSCPVSGIDTIAPSCLSVVVVLGKKPKEPFLVILQLLTAFLSRIPETGKKLSLPHNSSQELLTFLAGLGDIPDLRSFCDVLRQWFACDVLAVGSGQQGGRKVRLKSVSDVATVDSKTSQSRLFLKVMQDCLQQNTTLAWPALHSESAPEESLLVKELVQANGLRQGVVVQLPGISGNTTVLVFLWSEEGSRAEQIEELIRAVPLLGLMLQTLGSTRSAQPVVGSQPLATARKKVTLAVLTVIVAVFVFYPANFSLHPACQVVPVQVRYIVARFDGLLHKVFVESGDKVAKKSKLATLDGRELELELRSINADSAKALKLRDNHLATGNASAAQIGFLEYQRLQERANLLGIRQQQLNLESPVDGIVLSGDLKRAEGGPVTKGQILFEVAPLEKVLIELAVIDADISHVKNQAPVTIRFDAFPGRSWQGKVDRIAPKSTLLQGQNVFIVSLQVVNPDKLLQPGMQGRASVACGRKSLLWIYFHKPWYALSRLFTSLL